MVIRCPVLGDGLGDAGVARQFSIEMANANPQNRIDLVIIAGINFEPVKWVFSDNNIPPNLKIHFMQAEYDHTTKDPVVPDGPPDKLRTQLSQERNPIVLIDVPIPNPNYGFGWDHAPTVEALKKDLDGWLVSHPSLYYRISEHGSYYCHTHNSKIGIEYGIPELISLGISSGRDDPSLGMIFPKAEERNVNELSCKNHPYIRTFFGDDLDMAAYHKNHVLTTVYGGSNVFPTNIVALQCALTKDNIDTVDALVTGSVEVIESKLAAARDSLLWREMGVKNLISVDRSGRSTSLVVPDPDGTKTVRFFMHGLKNNDIAIIQSLAMQGLESNNTLGVGGASGDSSLIELMGHALKQAQHNSPAQLFPAIYIRHTEHFNNWAGLLQTANKMGNFYLMNVLHFLCGYNGQRDEVYSAERIKSVAGCMQMPDVKQDFRRLLSIIYTQQNALRISWDIDKALVELKAAIIKSYV